MQELIEIYNKTRYLYEKYYDIHLCSIDEIDEVIKFIDNYWQKNHILTKSRELLNWQHLDRENNRYNFVIAKSKKSGEIHGIIGFIISSIYDSQIKTPIRWGVIWKIRDDVAIKGLGLALKGYMESTVPAQYIGGVGLSKYSKVIDKKLGERMGKLCQYYIANPYIQNYNLISNPEHGKYNKSDIRCESSFDEIGEEQFKGLANTIKDKIMPYKSVKYYVNRYFRHPIYNYKCYQIENDGTVEAIFFCRKCSVNNSSNIFLVDYIGDGSELNGRGKQFIELLHKENAESISFPCDGISEQFLKDGGFSKREDSEVVLPVYYEPFVKQNVDLDFHFWSNNCFRKAIIVKGDADQDRPNILQGDYDE